MSTKRHAVALSAVMLTLLFQGAAIPEASALAVSAPADTDVLRTDLVHSSGFSSKSMEKLRQAIDTVERVFNSEEFHQAILNFTYNGQRQFASNGGLTNEQIYARIMAARETYTSVEDHVAQLDLNLYTPPWYKKWSVVGYGYPGSPEIWMNWYYFNSFSVAEVAGNVAHEWTHKIGFEHDYNRTARRPYSVPYAVGDLVIKLSASLQ